MNEWTKHHPLIINFWDNIKSCWDKLYHQIFNGEGVEALNYIQNQLPKDIFEEISFEITFGEGNKQAIPAYSKIVELYISPRHKESSLPIMDALYDSYIELDNLIVCKYKPYHKNDPLISEIDFGTFKVNYNDFGVQISYGFSEQKKPILNLVIMVNKKIAEYILDKQKMWFKNPETKNTTSRDVWVSKKTNAIDLFLLNILGEYHLMHNIGYIELLPSDDPIITKDTIFTELSDLRNEIELINKNNHYKICNYCQHHEMQIKIKNCSRCHTTYYCSKICQIADYKRHKMICK